jgi:hypothetical protein
MMIFQKIKPSDKDKIYELYARQKTLGTEYCLVTLFEWHKKFNLEAAIGDDYVCLRLYFKGKLYYFPPLTTSKQRFSELLDALIGMGAQSFAEVTDFTLPEFCKRNFTITPNRDMAEYVYSSKSFISLEGKSLHSKRNHISQFVSSYKYAFETYNSSYRAGVMQLLDQWNAQKLASLQNGEGGEDAEYFKATARAEKELVQNVLDNLEFYNCFADVLLVDGKVIGASFGEILPTGVGAVYFEKADTAYNGAYTMLANLFAGKHFSDVAYINRQEDMGNEGLRKAKLSYKPKYIFMKYLAQGKKDRDDRFSEDVIQLYKDSFPEDDEATVNYFFNNVFSPDRLKNIRIGDTLVSALHIVPKTLDYCGKQVFLPFMVGISTAEQFKNKGYASRLIDETLRCMHSQNVPFTALYPAIEGFYKRLGFEKVFNESATDESLGIERRPTTDIETLTKLLAKKTAPYQVKIVRNAGQMKIKYGCEEGANLLYLNGKLIGYELVSAGKPQEVCLIAEDGSPVPPYEIVLPPKGMARIVNLKAAFSLLNLSRPYKFKLTDCLINENNGVFEAYKDTVTPSVGYDFTITERQLAKLFFGLPVEGVPKQFIDEFPKLVFMTDKY